MKAVIENTTRNYERAVETTNTQFDSPYYKLIAERSGKDNALMTCLTIQGKDGKDGELDYDIEYCEANSVNKVRVFSARFAGWGRWTLPSGYIVISVKEGIKILFTSTYYYDRERTTLTHVGLKNTSWLNSH